MNILGVSALDKASCATLISDKGISTAIMEERIVRVKNQNGFPIKALKTLFNYEKINEKDIDYVAYPFYNGYREAWCGPKSYLKDLLPTIFTNQPIASKFWHNAYFARWAYNHVINHINYHKELKQSLKKLNLLKKLKRVNHQLAHAASAYYTSGFQEKTLILTLDWYGSDLAGSVCLGSKNGIEFLEKIKFPNSLGMFYAYVTAALGFKVDRHEGKIVGLAAFGDKNILFSKIYSKFKPTKTSFYYKCSADFKFAKNLAKQYPREHVAAAYQAVLEKVVADMVQKYVDKYKVKAVALAGGVCANVKMNQRVFEVNGIKKIFIHPAMGDDGTGTGAALYLLSKKQTLKPFRLNNSYFGPDYSEEEIKKELKKAKLKYQYYEEIEPVIAELIAKNKVVARFDGRMEYGPRALGNRSILYQATDPSVNDWLNKRLKRTEFMPFAPVTLERFKKKCYKNITGADYAAEFMTITFDCTDYMKKTSPAAVHVDNTARPQITEKRINPSYNKILEEYYKLTKIPTIINTSFNMHEEPIVCTPNDAIRSFKAGNLDCLAIGNFLVKN
jgi:carbamoyltransferase